MSTQREIARKFRQLDNDVSSIYEILDRVQATQLRHGTRLDGIDTRLDGIDTRLHRMDTRLDGIDTRLHRMDTRLDGMDTRLDGIDGKLGMVVELLERR